MIDVVSRLMNSIRIIYSISTYYNTSERLTSLFVKVTNQMIATCRSYIYQGVARIWDLSSPDLLRRLEYSIQLNREYQKQFHQTKDRLQTSPEERQFELRSEYCNNIVIEHLYGAAQRTKQFMVAVFACV